MDISKVMIVSPYNHSKSKAAWGQGPSPSQRVHNQLCIGLILKYESVVTHIQNHFKRFKYNIQHKIEKPR